MSAVSKTGLLITLEGIDYSGKSTQADMLAARLVDDGLPVRLLREPGGTELSERIRSILLDRGELDICARSELLLFCAARAQLVERVISPELTAGRVVICDRYYDSTFAYQAYGRGLHLESVKMINSFATAAVDPSLTLLFDLPVEAAIARRSHTQPDDRLEREKLEFHRNVRDGYLALAQAFPDRIRMIPADMNVKEVWRRAWDITRSFLKQHGYRPS
jgi:dTMP kinase